MKNKIQVLIHNFSYTLASNLVSLAISSLVVLIVPKLIGVQEYGYWQLYLFYASYVGFFQFGWNDGVYLRYGGDNYEKLDKRLFFSQFWMLFISQLIISGLIITISTFIVNNVDKKFIFLMVALCLIIVGVRCMLLFILQATNRMKEYAQITMTEKILYCFFIILFLILGLRQFKLLIVADLIGKLFSFSYAVYLCNDIVIMKPSAFYFNIKEAVDNINVGIKLMFANIASMLIIGIVRFGIERVWDIANFGKISLTLSVSNLMMIFISAVGIVMFPVLRRTDENRLPGLYVTMRNLLMVALFGMLIFYYPLKVILSAWLPQYAESLMFMALVFPMCVYEGKMSLLINTYFKTMRKEKLMLFVNIITVIFSIIVTYISTVLLHNLILSVTAIVVLLAFRCSLAEIFLSKILKISTYKDIVLDIMLSLIFILTSWFADTAVGILAYATTFVLYLLIKKAEILITVKDIKNLVRG